MNHYDTIYRGGALRWLALHPRTTMAGACGRLVGAGDAPQVIPRDRWQAVSLEHFVPGIKDQDGLSYCHSYAGALAGEVTYAAAGVSVRFSGTGLGCVVTGGVNRGAGIDEVLAAIATTGFPLEEDVPEYSLRGSGWKDGWKERASRYCAVEYYDCGHDGIFDKLSSLLQLGFVGVFGCARPFGPHALVVVGLRQVAGRWTWRIANSWSTRHGDRGFDQLTEDQIGGEDQYGAWGLRACLVGPDGAPLPRQSDGLAGP
jgi:hypothetical protein